MDHSEHQMMEGMKANREFAGPLQAKSQGPRERLEEMHKSTYEQHHKSLATVAAMRRREGLEIQELLSQIEAFLS